MTDVKSEALRYLGYKDSPPDSATKELLNKGYSELTEHIIPNSCHRMIPKENAGLLLKGNDITKHLEKSDRVIFFAATLGTGADKLIRTAEIQNMAYAVVLDALASALTEKYCDETEEKLKTLYGGHFTWRFSPGYGDYPIEIQHDLIAFLKADKLIGLTATESHILIPRKSVTAVIGISDSEQDKGVRSCATCSMKDICRYRRSGNNCS